jgi:hypothetical protein
MQNHSFLTFSLQTSITCWRCAAKPPDADLTAFLGAFATKNSLLLLHVSQAQISVDVRESDLRQIADSDLPQIPPHEGIRQNESGTKNDHCDAAKHVQSLPVCGQLIRMFDELSCHEILLSRVSALFGAELLAS